MNWTRTFGGLLAAAAVCAGASAQGGVIGQWGLTSTSDYAGTSAFPASVVTVNAFRVGSGVSGVEGNGTWLYGTGWNVASPTATKCYEISVTAQGGAVLSVDGVAMALRASPTGASKVRVEYSTDGGASWVIAKDEAFQNDKNKHEWDVDFSAQSSGTFVVRISGYGGTGSTGNFGIYANTLKLLGSATSGSSAPVVTVAEVLTAGVGDRLEAEVRVLPSLAGTTTNCAMDPAPSGGYGLEGGKFWFTPAAGDYEAPSKDYRLTVTAANANGEGSATSTVRVVPGGAYLTGFEGLGVGTWNGVKDCDGVTWAGSTLLVTNLNGAVGERCVEFTRGGGYLETTEAILPRGVGTVSFLAWTAGSEGYDLQPVSVEISADGETWASMGSVEFPTDGPRTLSVEVGVGFPVRVRLRLEGSGGIRYVAIDDLMILPYTETETDYEKFLLKYNVTPGDDLTGEAEDYDGDGFSNRAEMDADTDPYDETVHP